MIFATAAAKSFQSCPTLCDPIDGSPPDSSVPGVLQARILERVAISFFNAWRWKVKMKSLSHDRLFPAPWTETYQASPSMRFSQEEYWSGLPFPSPLWYLPFKNLIGNLTRLIKNYDENSILLDRISVSSFILIHLQHFSLFNLLNSELQLYLFMPNENKIYVMSVTHIYKLQENSILNL